jgi:Insertion element 4 transposase N-terminal
VVAEAARTQERQRLLPARVVVYFTLAMCLFGQVGYQQVARLGAGGLGRARRWQQWWRVPSTAAIVKARARLGAAPLKRLFAEVAGPLATPSTRGRGVREISRVAGVTNLGCRTTRRPVNGRAGFRTQLNGRIGQRHGQPW